jgi:hypothetical protein
MNERQMTGVDLIDKLEKGLREHEEHMAKNMLLVPEERRLKLEAITKIVVSGIKNDIECAKLANELDLVDFVSFYTQAAAIMIFAPHRAKEVSLVMACGVFQD